MQHASLKSFSEAELAAFQTQQSGNNCVVHAITAALKLLAGAELSPKELSTEVDRLWWHGRFFRVFPGWGIPPLMQMRLVNYLARTHGFPVRARLNNLHPEGLHQLLEDNQKAVLITLYWLPGKAPALYHGASAMNFNATRKPGGHTMLLAAYQPGHASGNLETPWGFINSWADGSHELFWMDERTFLKASNLAFLPLNLRPSVIIEHTSELVKAL